jgi:NADH:ubiquinone oxidoreductase subunit 6 (subunit J)
MGQGADRRKVAADALISGYHTAFFWGAVMLVLALITAITLINAKKDDIPSEGAVGVA